MVPPRPPRPSAPGTGPGAEWGLRKYLWWAAGGRELIPLGSVVAARRGVRTESCDGLALPEAPYMQPLLPSSPDEAGAATIPVYR